VGTHNARSGVAYHLATIKMKMVEFTQTRPTPFYNGILGGNCWWYWLKHCHLEFNSGKLKGWRFAKPKA